MDTVAAAALAAIVDHDCARVLQDVVAENAALHQELEDAVVYDGRGVIRKLMTANDALCEHVEDMTQHFQDILDLNDALIQQRDTLRQQRKELKTNLRWQAFVNSELHKAVAVLLLRVARLRNARLKLYVLATRQYRRTKRRVYK